MMNDLQPINNANQLVSRIASIGNVFIALLMFLAVIYIIWNVVQYIIRGNQGEARKEALQSVIWGIVGLAIILSIWGLVNILLGTFNTNSNAPKDRFPNADLINNPETGGSVHYNSGSGPNGD